MDPYAEHNEGETALRTLEKALRETLRGKVVPIEAVVPFRRKKPRGARRPARRRQERSQ